LSRKAEHVVLPGPFLFGRLFRPTESLNS
jgi:hypothetical protein